MDRGCRHNRNQQGQTRVMSRSSNEAPGCLGIFLKMLGIGPRADSIQRLPYRLGDDFLSPAEISFYHVLLSIKADNLVICPKVNLADVFYVVGTDRSQAARNRIDRKHVDFLLCDANSMRPVAGIELDDASHDRSERQSRDAFVQAVFNAAGLPLIRFAAQSAYNVHEIAEQLAAALNPNNQPPQVGIEPPMIEPVASGAGGAPVCPKCGIPLVMRNSHRGKFYGCQNYPRCRETAAIE